MKIVEIWLGAYTPHMLRLTGEKADGWLPSQSYIDMSALAELNARIEDAAAAGRSPAKARRMLNTDPRMEPERGTSPPRLRGWPRSPIAATRPISRPRAST